MRVLIPCLALLVLGACAQTEAAKDWAFTRAANTGNQYCVVQDEAMADQFRAGVNRELRENGAEFDAEVRLICDP